MSSEMDNDPLILASLYHVSDQYPSRSNSAYGALDQIPTNWRPNLHRKSNSACVAVILSRPDTLYKVYQLCF